MAASLINSFFTYSKQYLPFRKTSNMSKHTENFYHAQNSIIDSFCDADNMDGQIVDESETDLLSIERPQPPQSRTGFYGVLISRMMKSLTTVSFLSNIMLTIVKIVAVYFSGSISVMSRLLYSLLADT